MKFSYVLLFAVVVLCGACNKSRKAPNGTEVKVLREGTGEFAAPGQFVVMNMLFKDSKDSVWEDTKKRGIPVIIQVADTAMIAQEKGIESAFRVLKKSDSLSIQVTVATLYGDNPMPPTVNRDEKLTFLFGVIDITDREGISKLQQEIQQREMAKALKAQAGQLAMDSVAIDAFLAEKKINALNASSGVRYVITKVGTGPKPSLSNVVVFKYKGSFLTGEEFERSETPVEYPLTQLIQGWQRVFPLLPKGSQATLYIPSSLAYGAAGSPPGIPPNANLIFEVELVDFK